MKHYEQFKSKPSGGYHPALSATNEHDGAVTKVPVDIDEREFQGLRFSSKVVSVLMEVTPEMAAKWLGKYNGHNIPLSELKAKEYSNDMKSGRWQFTGEPIIFANDGHLNDGQKRLWAVWDSGTTHLFLIVFGVKREAQDVTDIGCARSGGSRLMLLGVKNWNAAYSLGHNLIVHRKYGMQCLNNPECQPTKSETDQFVLENKDRIESVAGRAWKGFAALGVPGSIFKFCFYLFSEQDEQVAEQFYQELSSGNYDDGRYRGRTAQNPVYHLRNRLILNRDSKAKLPKKELLALFFKAWVAYRDNAPVGVLKWNSSGPKTEKFPII